VTNFDDAYDALATRRQKPCDPLDRHHWSKSYCEVVKGSPTVTIQAFCFTLAMAPICLNQVVIPHKQFSINSNLNLINTV